MLKSLLAALGIIIAAPLTIMGTASYLNAQGPDRCDLHRDWNFNGETLVVETCRGSLNLVRSERIVARF